MLQLNHVISRLYTVSGETSLEHWSSLIKKAMSHATSYAESLTNV